METFIGVGQALVTWFMVVVGWLVVSDQTQYRELAKNASSRIDALRVQLKSIEKKAVSFHASAYSPEIAKELTRELKSISVEMAYLRKHSFIGLGTLQDSVSLKQAISRNNFDLSTFVIQAAGSPIILNIESATDALDRQLLDAAHNIVCVRRPLRKSVWESLVRAL